jgi:heme exporter protein D
MADYSFYISIAYSFALISLAILFVFSYKNFVFSRKKIKDMDNKSE